MAKAIPLLKAFMNESIPVKGGFIITSLFDPDTVYSIFEITAYSVVKDIFRVDNDIKFKTDGNRTHILVEPPIFSQKSLEPTYRDAGKSIPYRFYELNIITGRKQEKIMIPKEPLMLHTYFTIQETTGNDFSFLFYPTEDVYVGMRRFIVDILYNDCNVDKNDAIEASKLALETIKKFTIWGNN